MYKALSRESCSLISMGFGPSSSKGKSSPIEDNGDFVVDLMETRTWLYPGKVPPGFQADKCILHE